MRRRPQGIVRCSILIRGILLTVIQEVDIGGLDLSVYTTRMVASLVHFLYKFEYATFDNGDQSQATDEHPGPLTFHAKMFLLGDHLKVEVLKSHAEKQLLKVLLRNTRTSEVDLARACAVAYGKRRAAKRLCVRLVSYLVGHDQPFNGSHRCAELEQAMRDHPDFAIDLARATKMMLHAMQYNPHEHAPAYRCPKCKKDFFAFIFEVHCPYKCYYRCGAEYTAAEWNREHKHDLKEYTNKELGIVEVGEGAWWLD